MNQNISQHELSEKPLVGDILLGFGLSLSTIWLAAFFDPPSFIPQLLNIVF